MPLSRRLLLLSPFMAFAGCTMQPASPLGASSSGSLVTTPSSSNAATTLDRQVVAYQTKEAPGTIIVDPASHSLHLVQPGGHAMRYAVGVGRAGYGFSGRAIIGRKEEWPSWTPTSSMIAANPHVNRPLATGLPGGEENPLGARALYLYQDGRDTLYRIHGTNDPSSIGKSVSSGCIRMFNRDVVDLYERVPVGAPVIVV